MAGTMNQHDKRQSLKHVLVGTSHRVQLEDQEYLVDVVETRETEQGEMEAYVHFRGQDSRLDEWISAYRLKSADASSPAHRNSKKAITTSRSRGGVKEPTMAQSTESTELTTSLQGPTETVNNDSEPLKPRNINSIIFGMYEIGTWYHSPYPEEYGLEADKMYICEHCLKYMREETSLRTHKASCRLRSPPGDTIYQQGENKILRVDGKKHKLFSQNLCLLAKLFLDHKSVYYDIEGFVFYVLTEQDSRERRTDNLVGFFSKEKISYENNNLACIMILPPYQRKGYGKLMIEFSYELARHENQIGSPEKPLSDLGYRGYRSYWASVILRTLIQAEDPTITTIKELSNMTYIHENDVIDALQYAGLLKYVKNTNRTSDPSAQTICISRAMVENAINLTGAEAL